MRILACCFLALMGVSAFAQEAQQIPVGAVPRGVAFYPSGNQLIVGSFADNSVSVLDLASLELRTLGESVSTAGGVAVDDQLGLAVVANSESNEVTVIDLATLQVVSRVPVESRPLSVDINSTHIAVVSNSGSDSLSLIDLTTRTVVGTVTDVPVLPGAVLSGAVQAVAVNSATNMAVVASPAQNSIILVDLVEARVVDTLTVGGVPGGRGRQSCHQRGRGVQCQWEQHFHREVGYWSDRRSPHWVSAGGRHPHPYQYGCHL